MSSSELQEVLVEMNESKMDREAAGVPMLKRKEAIERIGSSNVYMFGLIKTTSTPYLYRVRETGAQMHGGKMNRPGFRSIFEGGKAGTAAVFHGCKAESPMSASELQMLVELDE